MVQTKEFFEKMLAELEGQLQKVNEELKTSPSGSVVRVKRGNRYSFFQVEKHEGKRIRKSITNNSTLINALARKAYLTAEIKLLRRDISALKQFYCIYEEPTYDRIISMLPERMLRYQLTPLPAEDWSAQEYPQSTYMPESKIHTTTRGLKVRSKSELLIAEKLYAHSIPFRYEQVLSVNGIQFAPDFTIKTESGKLIYWEHCGLTNNKEYMEKHRWKLSVYEEADIVPWDNLIITYDDKYGILNLSIIESEISNKIKV